MSSIVDEKKKEKRKRKRRKVMEEIAFDITNCPCL
jgi:hypothetical protein